MWRNWNTWVLRGNVKCTDTMENIQRFLRKLKIKLPYNPAVPLTGIHPKELKTGTQTSICTPMFIAALFTMAKGGSNASDR